MDASGNPLPDVQRVADAWVRAFAEIEGGQVVTPDALANIVLSETVNAVTTHVEGPLGDVLSRTQVEEALGQTKAGTAPGPDGISIDFSRLAGAWSAIQLTILYFKTTLHIATLSNIEGDFCLNFTRGEATIWTWLCTVPSSWQTPSAECQQEPGRGPVRTC